MTEPTDIATIRHTLMTGLAHNAAIAALDRLAKSPIEPVQQDTALLREAKAAGFVTLDGYVHSLKNALPQPVQPELECERCELPPSEHTEKHWCDNQSFIPCRPVQPEEAVARDAEAEQIIEAFGRGVTDMFEQMERGNWVDDHGHNVKLNKQMLDLMPIVQRAIDHRAALSRDAGERA